MVGNGTVVGWFLVVVVVEDEDDDVAPDRAYWPVNVCHTTEFFGSAHWSTGVVPMAATMKSCQICAGNVPPATAIPCTLVISIRASG